MAKSRMDKFVNRAFTSVTCSAANTLTFEQIRFAVGTFQGIGLLLHRVFSWPTSASLREHGAATDRLIWGLTLRDDLSNLDPSNQAVLTNQQVVGMGAGVEPFHLPIVVDWTSIPGGGLLVPANPLYAGITTEGAAAASSVRIMIEYTFMALSDAESIELLQTIIPGNV